MKKTLKLRSSLYSAARIGIIGSIAWSAIGGSCLTQVQGVSMFISSMKPEEIKHVHQMLKEKISHAQNPKEKEFLEQDLLKFEKSYINPDDYTLDVSIQAKGNVASFNIIATTNENKRFSPEYPCEAKGSLNGDALYVQPKLDVNKKGDLILKLSIILGQEEFLVVVPYKNGMEVMDDQKTASGPLKVTSKLKIKNKGFWG